MAEDEDVQGIYAPPAAEVDDDPNDRLVPGGVAKRRWREFGGQVAVFAVFGALAGIGFALTEALGQAAGLVVAVAAIALAVATPFGLRRFGDWNWSCPECAGRLDRRPRWARCPACKIRLT